VPPVVIANSVMVAPSDPYLEPSNNTQNTLGPKANLKIIMVVPYLDNQGNLANMENTIVAVFNKLTNSALVFNITSASGPSALDTPGGQFMTSDFTISIQTTWS
jgi:hypothetical protein